MEIFIPHLLRGYLDIIKEISVSVSLTKLFLINYAALDDQGNIFFPWIFGVLFLSFPHGAAINFEVPRNKMCAFRKWLIRMY